MSETVHLKVVDIDPERMTIHVEQGKGSKDRYVPLAVRLLEQLRTHWTQEPPGCWVFAHLTAARPIHPTTAQRAYWVAKRKPGSPSLAASMLSATPSPPTCRRRGGTCTPCSACWAIGTSPRPCATFT